jgi:hypothetical protein
MLTVCTNFIRHYFLQLLGFYHSTDSEDKGNILKAILSLKLRPAKLSEVIGLKSSCPSGKLQRILVSELFSQHAKLNMASFVLYLLVVLL